VPYNSNVWNILPVTTLITIDLRARKITILCFLDFCGKLIFFEEKLWHHKIGPQPVGAGSSRVSRLNWLAERGLDLRTNPPRGGAADVLP
jgi:hypothetical protein